MKEIVPHLEGLRMRGMLRKAADLIANEQTMPDCRQRAIMVHLLREVARAGKAPPSKKGRPRSDPLLLKENIYAEVVRRKPDVFPELAEYLPEQPKRTLEDVIAELAEELSKQAGREIKPETVQTLYQRGRTAARKRDAKEREIFAASHAQRSTKSR